LTGWVMGLTLMGASKGGSCKGPRARFKGIGEASTSAGAVLLN
jgi:hypothetical protein